MSCFPCRVRRAHASLFYQLFCVFSSFTQTDAAYEVIVNKEAVTDGSSSPAVNARTREFGVEDGGRMRGGLDSPKLMRLEFGIHFAFFL